MATLEDRVQTLADYVEAYTGRATFLADSNFTQPGTPYCTIKLINSNFSDKDIVTDTDGFHQEVRGLARLDYSIQAIGGNEVAATGAFRVLKILTLSFQADLPREALTTQGIGVVEIGEVRDASLVVGSNIEDRAMFILGVSASIPETYNFDTATQIEAELDSGVEPANSIVAPQDPPDCPAG